MIFSSIPFLYYFLPLALLLCYLVPSRARNAFLLLASLVFYAWGEPKYLPVMAAATALGYGFGLASERFRRFRKPLLVLSIASSLGFLLYFKYADFFLENLNGLGLKVPRLKLALPVGISFYTFQILSYTVDVYRGEVRAQRNPIDLACYVTFFPQLIAGPIVRYKDIAAQLRDRPQNLDNLRLGTGRFLVGLGKKVLLANLLGEVCAAWRVTADPSVLFSWLYAISYTLHIYFDFSGYSDMAIGLGKLFGFSFPENFNYPYISRSITEFWRRWHMVYTLAAVVLGFVLFDASSLSSALACVKGLFGLGGLPPVSTQGLYLLKSNLVLLAVAILGATPAPKRLWEQLEAKAPRLSAALAPLGMAALLLVSTACLVDGSYNPFLYFRF